MYRPAGKSNRLVFRLRRYMTAIMRNAQYDGQCFAVSPDWQGFIEIAAVCNPFAGHIG